MYKICSLVLVVLLCPLQAQNTQEDKPIKGGVEYKPIKKGDGKRDPFSSPFKNNAKNAGPVQLRDKKNRLPFSLGEVEVTGIYYQAGKGYRAIFKIGDQYEWWKVGTKLQDADLIDIQDGAVVFRHYTADDDVRGREVVKQLPAGH